MASLPYEERPYRPCVGIFLINENKKVFGGRRIDSRAKAWQMPQGGIDPGESAVEACMREMGEEIGTNAAEFLREHDDWLYYDIPLPLADRLWNGQFKGPMIRAGVTSSNCVVSAIIIAYFLLPFLSALLFKRLLGPVSCLFRQLLRWCQQGRKQLLEDGHNHLSRYLQNQRLCLLG